MANVFAELKRRNVIRMAGLYLVGAWLITQVASTVLPTFDVPSWALRGLIVILAIAFIPALMFSWIFELTTQGLKRDAEVRAGQSIGPQTGRRMDRMIIAVLVFALGYFAFDKFVLAPRRFTPNVPHTSSSPNEANINLKSIAVLPFENLSDEKSNAYFADGIQDEILTRLSKIAALKVISWTSTQKYKSAPDNLREVCQQLGVANLLEGSVQKVANAVHINVQLIRASSDEHLWAESYNRKLDDVFGVEGEVASAIADQLKAKLSGAEEKAVTQKPTENTAAYEAYLRGRTIEQSGYGVGPYQNSAPEYEKAVQLDPTFALAWARLAVVRSYLFWNAIDLQTNSVAAFKDAADHAMTLAPEAGESWVALAAYRYRGLQDFEAAAAALKEAQTRLPNDAAVLENLGWVLRRLGRWQEAEASFRKALELDPRDVNLLGGVANEFYSYIRRFDEAERLVNRALEISPDSPDIRGAKAGILQAEGKVAEAGGELARIPADAIARAVQYARINQALYERRFDLGIQFCNYLLQRQSTPGGVEVLPAAIWLELGEFQDLAGQHEQARSSFTNAVSGFERMANSLAWEAVGLARAYAGLGQKDQALAALRRGLEQERNNAVDRPRTEVALAQIQARFGDHDAAIAALPHLLDVPAGLNVSDLKLDPTWDPLRSDPRFQKLCETKSK